MSPLFQATIDGSLSRRFGVFVMIAAIVLIIVMMLRRGWPGTSLGPSLRIAGPGRCWKRRLSTEP